MCLRARTITERTAQRFVVTVTETRHLCTSNNEKRLILHGVIIICIYLFEINGTTAQVRIISKN